MNINKDLTEQQREKIVTAMVTVYSPEELVTLLLNVAPDKFVKKTLAAVEDIELPLDIAV